MASDYSSKAVMYIDEILSSFNESVAEIGANQISKKLREYPSTIHRLLTSLRDIGILEQNPETKKYRLGIRIFEIGLLYISHLNIHKIARPHLEQLATGLETNCHLGILGEASVMIVDRVQNLQSSSFIQRLSINVPLHCSALGKAMLAFLPKDEQRKLLNRMHLKKYTKSTITEKKKLERELSWIVKHSYAIDRGELHNNIGCVGVPILDRNSNVIASMSASDSLDRMTDQKIKKIVPELIRTSEFISRQL